MLVCPVNRHLTSPVSGSEDGVVSEAMAGEEAFCLVVGKRQQYIIVPHYVRVFTALLVQELLVVSNHSSVGTHKSLIARVWVRWH